MRAMQGLIAVVGRICLSLIFLSAAVANKIPNFSSVADHMAAEGIPNPNLMLLGAIVFLLAGSLSVVFGFRARIGAALLLVFLILAAYYFHDFWTMQGEQAQQQMIHFMKNLAMMGAMLLIIANGPGPMSVDSRRVARKREARASQEVKREEPKQ